MSRYQRTKSEFSVQVLDMKAFAKSTMLYLIGNGYDLNGNNRINTYYPLGIVTAKNGNRYIIDEDGCGNNPPLEEAPQKLKWYKSTVDEKENITSFDMFPFVEITYSKDEIEAIPVSGVKTLDEFIRSSGGDRLERNLGKWEKFLFTGIEPIYSGE